MLIKLKCEICPHEVATVDTEKLKMPIAGHMFGPPEEWIQSPFHADVDWQYMRCPMCRKRPFIVEGEFTTADGLWLRIMKNGNIDLPIVNKPMGDQFGDVIEGSEESNKIDAAWSQAIVSTKPGTEHECGETGLALMEDEPPEQDQTVIIDDVVNTIKGVAGEDLKAGQAVSLIGGTIKAYSGTQPATPDEADESKLIMTKEYTVEDEVMRLHALGMKPGQISRELKDKADITIHHLQISKKIKAIKKDKENAA